jgi:uncharacterized membrane protein (DUF106 family)
MEHPALDVNTIKEELTLEEIQGKVRELNERMSFAYRTQNQPLIDQLQMVYEVYTRAQLEKLNEMFGSSGDDNQSEKIDIT